MIKLTEANTDLDELFEWHHENLETLHPIDLISRFHARFEEIHPFRDGNGRVGREIARIELDLNSFPSFFIGKAKREIYLKSLNKAQIDEEYHDIVNLFYKLMVEESEEFHDIIDEIIEFALDNQELGDKIASFNDSIRELKNYITENYLR